MTAVAVVMLVAPALSLPRAQVVAAVAAAAVVAGEALAEAVRLVLLAAVAATATDGEQASLFLSSGPSRRCFLGMLSQQTTPYGMRRGR